MVVGKAIGVQIEGGREEGRERKSHSSRQRPAIKCNILAREDSGASAVGVWDTLILKQASFSNTHSSYLPS